MQLSQRRTAADADRYGRQAAGIWSANQAAIRAERKLAEQAEAP